MDRHLSELLRWGIENTVPSTAPGTNPDNAPPSSAATSVTAVRAIEELEANPYTNGATNGASASPAPAAAKSHPNHEVFEAYLRGPPPRELMKAAIDVIKDPSSTVENRAIAIENFEYLVEDLNNANLLAPKPRKPDNADNPRGKPDERDLWKDLLEFLGHEEPELRRMAASCIGTAVQNHPPTQKQLHERSGIVLLVALATREDETAEVRKKAVKALSSAVRNHQPAMDALVEELGKRGEVVGGKVDAGDMGAVDVVIDGLREKAGGSAVA